MTLRGAVYSGKWIELKELTNITHFGTAPKDAIIKRVMVVDVETTGLDRANDEITEIAFNLIEFDSDGNFYKILYSYNGTQEVQKELSTHSKILTGYSKESLRGTSIDWDLVTEVAKKADVVVAYNASFDRQFLERYCDIFKEKFWACAMTEIPYIDILGYKGTQEVLAMKLMNIYYNAHNALIDVHVLSLLLNQEVKSTGKTLFYVLMKLVTSTTFKVHAKNAKFDDKDTLKMNGYTWDSEKKVWAKETRNKEIEIDFLNALDYNIDPIITEINGFNKFRATNNHDIE